MPNWSKVKVATNEGGRHRAIVLAEQLHAAGLWDGQTEIYFPDPYDAHRCVSLGRTAAVLIADQDYVIGKDAGSETAHVRLDATSVADQATQLSEEG